MRVFGSVEKVRVGGDVVEVEGDVDEEAASCSEDDADDVDDVLASDVVLCIRSHGRACNAGTGNNFA